MEGRRPDGTSGAPPRGGQPPKDLEWSERVHGRESTFVVSPSRMPSIPLLVGASIWDSFFVMLWMGLARAHAPDRAFLFPVAHGIIGLIVTWLALVRTLNVSRIALDPILLVVSQSPVPRPAARIPVERLDRFEIREEKGWTRGWRKPRTVNAVLKGGRRVRLPLDLDALEDLDFVTARLNSALATALGQSTRADPA